MKRFCLSLFLLLSVSMLFAQDARLRRLKDRLHAAANDKERAVVLDSLSMYYLNEYDKALKNAF
jgi:hypothetical protein